MSSYIDHHVRHGPLTITTHSWAEFTHARLVEIHGPDRADRIAAGYDTRTNADLALWNSLGQPKTGRAA